MTSLNVTREQSLSTLNAAFDAGVNFFDTAYLYGESGESEKLIAEALGPWRDEIVIATKGGIHWDDQLNRQFDGSPAALKSQCETSLRRLATDRVEVYYLHAPDPALGIEDSARAIAELIASGKALAAGASNCSLEQLRQFHAVCPLAVIQPPYNMLMRDIEAEIIPWCVANNIAIACYWPLLKGLLAGKLPRDHPFDPRDGRAKYPMFQGEEWQKNQDLIDDLRAIAGDVGKTIAQLAVGWAIAQPGVTSAICGAKRPEQIVDTASAIRWKIDDDTATRIAAALAKRGPAVTRSAI